VNSLFITILYSVVLPIIVLIVVGSVLQRIFQLDLYTLSKINFYCITPATVFMSLYHSNMNPELLGSVVLFYALYILILYILGSLTSRIMGYKGGKKAAFNNSIMLDNSGNYGLPVNQLVFSGEPLAASMQALIMSLQSLLTFTYGVISIQGSRLQGNYRSVIIGFLKMPVPYALALGLIMHALAIPLPTVLAQPLTYAQQSMVAIALITLGAQIVKYPLRLYRSDIYISMVLRLFGGPLIGLMLILLLDMHGIPAQALLIASAMPTGVNTSILAEEYRNEPDFAAQTVLISTIVNVFTITAVIALSGHL